MTIDVVILEVVIVDQIKECSNDADYGEGMHIENLSTERRPAFLLISPFEKSP